MCVCVCVCVGVGGWVGACVCACVCVHVCVCMCVCMHGIYIRRHIKTVMRVSLLQHPHCHSPHSMQIVQVEVKWLSPFRWS